MAWIGGMKMGVSIHTAKKHLEKYLPERREKAVAENL